MSLMKASDTHLNISGSETDEQVPPCGPIRIRNLEDLLRQLEQNQGHSNHSSGAISGISPSGSEEIRLSEPEADRHLYSSSAASSRHHMSQPHSSSGHLAPHYRTPSAGSHPLAGSGHPGDPNQHMVDQGLQYLLGHRHLGIPPPPPPAGSRFKH